MHYNESEENYLETILMLSKKLPVVRSVDIANELGFKKSSISIAMKHLREKEYITVSDAGFISLTASGQAVADMVLELLKEGECTLRQIVQRVPAPSDSIIQTLYALAEQQKIVAGDNSTFSLPDRGSKK